MKRFLQFAAIAAAVLLISVAAQAQFRMRAPSLSGVWNPEVGAGAFYETQEKDGTKRTMEMAIVGKESVGGKDGVWFEISFTRPNGNGEMVMKSLFVEDGDMLTLKREVMQMPGRPPMEMPEMMLQQMSSKPQTADIRNTSDDLGSDTVTTPAGTFSCEHYKAKDGSGEFWIKKNIGPFGLVKGINKDGATTVLTKVVTDAKDKITGKPQPMGMGMGGPPQR